MYHLTIGQWTRPWKGLGREERWQGVRSSYLRGLNDGFRDLLTSSLPLFPFNANVLTQPIAFSNYGTYMNVYLHPILPFRLCLAYYPFDGQFECGHEICYANS